MPDKPRSIYPLVDVTLRLDQVVELIRLIHEAVEGGEEVRQWRGAMLALVWAIPDEHSGMRPSPLHWVYAEADAFGAEWDRLRSE
jgi:hypothetical protein